MQIKKLILIIIVISTSLLTSCYDSVDIDDMAYVLSIGMDEESADNILFTFQIAVPLNISGGVETGFAESEESVSVHNISIIAKDLFSAIEIANNHLAKEINISHCKIVLLSERITSKVFREVVSTINNYDEFRPDTLIALCEINVQEYLNSISSPFEKNPSRYYDAFFKKNFSSQDFYTEINQFEKNIVQVIPLLSENPTDSKSVILNDYNNIAILSEEETIAYKILSGKFSKGNITIPELNTAIMLQQNTSPKIFVNTTEQKPIYKIKLSFHIKPPHTESAASKTKNETEKYIKQICFNFLNKTSKVLGIDTLGLIDISKPQFLTINSFENYNWSKKIKTAEFDVTVNCDLKK